MRALRFPLILALVSLAACADDGNDPSTASKKLAAQQSMGEGALVASPDTAVSSPTRPAQDPCAQEGWYGDGECDYWCPAGDTKDCASGGGGGVACAAFWSPADGYCNTMDPCGPYQDEDCQKGGDTDPGCVDPSPATGDGKCEPTSLAEFKADPDCQTIACPALYALPDGVCNAKSACDWVIDADCADAGGGVVCDAIRYETNGKCEAPAGCEQNDPDDCVTGVSCIEIAYPANGKCEAAPGCGYTDPKDCPVACITILYPTNGKCEAAPGCEASDADC